MLALTDAVSRPRGWWASQPGATWLTTTSQDWDAADDLDAFLQSDTCHCCPDAQPWSGFPEAGSSAPLDPFLQFTFDADDFSGSSTKVRSVEFCAVPDAASSVHQHGVTHCTVSTPKANLTSLASSSAGRSACGAGFSSCSVQPAEPQHRRSAVVCRSALSCKPGSMPAQGAVGLNWGPVLTLHTRH